MASAAELSFNWTGFISAMISNLTFGFRAVLGKKCAPAFENRRLPRCRQEFHTAQLVPSLSRCRQPEACVPLRSRRRVESKDSFRQQHSGVERSHA